MNRNFVMYSLKKKVIKNLWLYISYTLQYICVSCILASAIHNNAWQHFLIRNCSFLFTELMFSTVSIFTWTHPLLQIFETLLVQNFNKLWLKILVTIPCPTGDWAVRLQVVQHVHFLLRSLSIKSNITCQQGFCFKLPKKKPPKNKVL